MGFLLLSDPRHTQDERWWGSRCWVTLPSPTSRCGIPRRIRLAHYRKKAVWEFRWLRCASGSCSPAWSAPGRCTSHRAPGCTRLPPTWAAPGKKFLQEQRPLPQLQSKSIWAMAYTWRPIFTLPDIMGTARTKLVRVLKKHWLNQLG